MILIKCQPLLAAFLTVLGFASFALPGLAASGQLTDLRRQTDSWKIISDKRIQQAIKTATGSAYSHYVDATQLVSPPEIHGDEILVTGGVRGLYTEMESVLIINTRNKRVTVGVLDHRTLTVYGANSRRELPISIKLYQTDFEKRAEDKLTITVSPPKPPTQRGKSTHKA